MYNKTVISYIDSFYERFCAKGSALLAVHFIKFLRRTRSRSSAGGFSEGTSTTGRAVKDDHASDVKEANSSINNRMSEGKKDSNSNSKFTNSARLFSIYTRIKANTAKWKVHQKSQARDYVSRWTSH